MSLPVVNYLEAGTLYPGRREQVVEWEVGHREVERGTEKGEFPPPPTSVI